MATTTTNPTLDYDRARVERQLEDTPAFARRMLAGPSDLNGPDIFSIYATRKIDGGRDEVFPLRQLSGNEVATQLALAPAELSRCFAKLAAQVGRVLRHQNDAISLEHEAILFWPSLADLHDFLGVNLRVDELIVAFDLLRSAFQTRPVTVLALSTLENILQAASVTQHFTTEMVDGWVDRLAEAGLDLQLPLTHERGHAA
jgi:hypothetical protein